MGFLTFKLFACCRRISPLIAPTAATAAAVPAVMLCFIKIFDTPYTSLKYFCYTPAERGRADGGRGRSLTPVEALVKERLVASSQRGTEAGMGV